jgi:hypothetical protein
MSDASHEGPRDLQLAAEFGALLVGGRLTDGPPDPDSRLGRADAIWARCDAGDITEEDAHEQIKEIMREAMSEADGIWVSGDLLKPELRHLGGMWIPFERE